MPTMDIFNDNAFGMIELTDAINIVPNMYGRINELGLFPERGVSTTAVAVEMKDGVLNLLPQTTRGGPASVGNSPKRNLRSFNIPQFAHEDYVTAGEVQGVRAYGSTTELMAVMDVVNEKQAIMAGKHNITLEWLRAGALRGVVMDDGGNTIYNWFTEFGITEKVVDFDLGNTATDVAAKIHEVSGHIEDNLKGETMAGLHCLASPQWMAKLLKNAKVREAYVYQQGANLMRNDLRKRFEFHGCVFEEYRGQATDAAGNVRKFIAEGDARFFPLGTQSTFSTYNAPADFFETVNTPGQRLYTKLAVDPEFQRWAKIHTQSNPLPICKRPALLVRGHSGS